MPYRFRPTGHFDIETDPSVLPEQSEGGLVFSGAMTRCKNLRLDRPGQVSTRYGSSRLTSVSGTVSKIVEQGGKRYEFSTAGIYENETLLEAATAGTWRAAQYKYYLDDTEYIYATDGTFKYAVSDGAVRQWGITAPSNTPTLATTGAGATYDVTITWARYETGTLLGESGPSPTGSIVAGGNLEVSEATPPTDPQVTHFRVYISAAGGGVMYYAGNGLVGSTAVINLSTVSLGNVVPTDHDRLPDDVTCMGGPVNGYLFAGVGNRLYFSLPQQPEYWPPDYYIEVGAPQAPLVAIVEHNATVFLVTTLGLWQLYGTGADSFYVQPIHAKAGAVSEWGVEAVPGMGIFHIDQDGLYLWDGSIDSKVSGRLGPIWRGETVGSTPGANLADMSGAWVKLFRDKVYIGYPTTTTEPDHVVVIQMGDGRSSLYAYSVSLVAAGVDRTASKFYAADPDGYVWRLEDDTADDDNGTDISWDVESKLFTDTQARYFPRSARYDIDVTSGTASGAVMLDGETVQTHTLTGTRDIKKRLITSCNGQRLSHRVSGTGSAIFYGTELT